MVARVEKEMPRWLVASLHTKFERQARIEDKRIRRLLDSDRYRHFMAALAGAVVRPPLNARAASSAVDVLSVGLCDTLSILHATVDAYGPSPSHDELHEIRILAKRVRYNAALSYPLLGLLANDMASSLEEVQRILGELHDRVLVLTYLNKEFDKVVVERPDVDVAALRASIERKLTREINRLNGQWRQPYGEARRHGEALCRAFSHGAANVVRT
jgi:CHAD domain-containing protein